jgi:hypothetical protein
VKLIIIQAVMRGLDPRIHLLRVIAALDAAIHLASQ